MFEAAELQRKTTKADFDTAIPELRSRLLAAQRALRETKTAVVIVVSGVEAAGKSEVVNRLTEWVDARGVETHAFLRDSDEERERPRYWKFWRALPKRGTIGILFGSWYTQPIVDRVFKRTRPADLDRELQRIAFFERMLALDGVLFIKLWFHISKDEQRKRLAADANGPDVKQYTKMYDRFAEVSERAIRMTDTAEAPWRIIEATDRKYRDLTAGRILLEALEDIVKQEKPVAAKKGSAHLDEGPELTDPKQTVLDRTDLTQKLDDEEYDRKLARAQKVVARAAWKAWNQRRSAVILFEGWDAAGKGGAIRRLVGPIDARINQIISVAAPTDEERAHHYLWRFWRHLPRAGKITIYDRTWYGRVLVERVEGFARPDEWARAYREINDFEEQLVESGIVLLKFWLHIDEEEQLRRFHEREQIDYKKHKITDEDWRNREKWNAYKLAVHDVINRTSSSFAPWHVVAANDKKFARVEVVRTVGKALESALR
ncbi:MAG: polyphosphate:AMP phosphotransferase [Thermoanaerobaculia bacterium]